LTPSRRTIPGGIARFVDGVLARLAEEGFDPEDEDRLL
jgi:hypothetical protein